jgi:glycosyltransferase involved in cell wall biosynthesis
VLEHAHEVDVLHSHLGPRLVPLSTRIGVPVVHTVHTSISSDMRWILEQFPGRHITAVSRWQAIDGLAEWTVVPNGIELDAFPFAADKDDYLLTLGRVEAAKGVHVAIDVARASGRPLVIAGPIVDGPYFAERIRPRLDDRVRWVGPVGGTEKLRLLQRAHALLFPAQWDEAFGLVMVEAMACGTPVVAIARGAVAEIVIDGVNGFRASGVAALPDLVARVSTLDRVRVRASVTERFSHRQMTDAYLRLYRRVVAESRRQAGPMRMTRARTQT